MSALVFFCAPLFTFRSLIRLRTQELDGLLAKINRESTRNLVDELSSSSMSEDAHSGMEETCVRDAPMTLLQ